MDLITFVPDLRAMVDEAIAIQDDEDSELAQHFTINDDGGVSFNVLKIPVQHGHNQSVCLVRGISRSVIESSTTIKVIGEVIGGDYVFDEGGRDIYEYVYNTKSRMIDDGEGGQISYTPPYKIGGFF